MLLWLGWLLIHIVIFSMTSGTIHPYYVIAMAPAVAVLVGIGAPYIWQAYTRRTKIAWLLPLSIAATTILSVVMLGYNNYWPWLIWLVIATGGVVTILTLLPLAQTKRLKQIILSLAIIVGMAAPIAFSISTVATAHSGSIPTAGPGATAINGTNNESAQAESSLIAYLLANQNGATWIAAVNSANESAPIQLSSGQPVMAIGGFNGSDSTLTLAQFKQLVKEGKVRYYVASSGQGKSGGPGGNSEIASWATAAALKSPTAAHSILFTIFLLLKNPLSSVVHTTVTNLNKGVNMTKQLNLTTDEALVLQQIIESGEEDLTGLTESLQMSRPKLMSQLSRLKNKGLIKIKTTTGDWWVSMSRRGKQTIHYLWPEMSLNY